MDAIYQKAKSWNRALYILSFFEDASTK